MLIDTHCHIHEADFSFDKVEVIKRAHKAGVNQIICVGTNTEDSILALEFSEKHKEVFASVGVHPHYADKGLDKFFDFFKSINFNNKIIAIGEIGLDYHYPNDPSHQDQIKILKQQIELALDHDLPIIFHVREAYDDFWKVLDSFKGDDRQILVFCTALLTQSKTPKKGWIEGYISASTVLAHLHTINYKKKCLTLFHWINYCLKQMRLGWYLTPYAGKSK